MHNCRLMRSNLIDLAMDELSSAEANQLLSEVNGCSVCREEYTTLRNTWRVSGQALQSVLPTEEFWPGYNARLKDNLTQRLNEEVEETSRSLRRPLWLRIRIAVVLHAAGLLSLGRTLATTSVRVPVPVALGVMFLFGVSVLALAGRSSIGRASIGSVEPVKAVPSTEVPSVETRLVQVPVIQERVVTRVVYVEKKSSRSTTSNPRDREYLSGSRRLVGTGSDVSAETAMSLVGFKPTDQVKLSIVKGEPR